jgi:hypothetical protein
MMFFSVAGSAKGLSVRTLGFAASESRHDMIKLEISGRPAKGAMICAPFAFLPIRKHFMSSTLSMKSPASSGAFPRAVSAFAVSELSLISVERIAALFAFAGLAVFKASCAAFSGAMASVSLFNQGLDSIKGFSACFAVSGFSRFLRVLGPTFSGAGESAALRYLARVSVDIGAANRALETQPFTHSEIIPLRSCVR